MEEELEILIKKRKPQKSTFTVELGLLWFIKKKLLYLKNN